MDTSNMSVDQLIAQYQNQSTQEETQNIVEEEKSTQETQETQENFQNNTINNEPPNPIFEELSSKLFSEDLFYYGSQRFCPKARLSSLPESTLKKLIKIFN